MTNKTKDDIIQETIILNSSIKWWHEEISLVMNKIDEIDNMSFSKEKEALEEEYQGRLSYLLGKAKVERAAIEKLQKMTA